MSEWYVYIVIHLVLGMNSLFLFIFHLDCRKILQSFLISNRQSIIYIVNES